MNSLIPGQSARESVDLVPAALLATANSASGGSPSQLRAERELQRIAAAFGVETFSQCWSSGEFHHRGFSNGVVVSWNIDEQRGTLAWVAVGDRGNRCLVARERNLNYGSYEWCDAWEFEPSPQFHALMARGLYCLDFDEPAILAQLKSPLSYHQQIEYVLHMPREFWPSEWLAHARDIDTSSFLSAS